MLKSSFSCPSNCLCSPPGILLLLVQNNYKDTRQCRPCGLPCAARQWRNAKKSLTLRQVWRRVPPPAALLSGSEWGTARLRIPFQVGDIRMIHIFPSLSMDLTFNPNNRTKQFLYFLLALCGRIDPVRMSLQTTRQYYC